MIPIAMGAMKRGAFLVLHDCTRESKQQQELLVKIPLSKRFIIVKNNLQTVAGLLRMEARRSSLPDVKQALQEGLTHREHGS